MKQSTTSLKWMLALVVATGFVFCAGAAMQGQQSQPTVITEEQNHQAVPIGVGEEVTVELPLRQDAYQWRLMPEESKLVAGLQQSTLRRKDPQAGDVTYQVFRFKVPSAGVVTLHFKFTPGDVYSTRPDKVFVITLRAK